MCAATPSPRHPRILLQEARLKAIRFGTTGRHWGDRARVRIHASGECVDNPCSSSGSALGENSLTALEELHGHSTDNGCSRPHLRRAVQRRWPLTT